MQDALTERKRLAGRIKIARHRADLTKGDLSRLVKIDPATYARYENGENEPRISMLKKIALHTKQDPVWLFNGEESSINNIKE